MAKSKRARKFTPEQKAEILRRHLEDKVPISKVCEQFHIQPSVYYTWQKQVFTQLEGLLAPGRAKRKDQGSVESKLTKEVEQLREKLKQKDSVIAEMSGEYVALKKELGEP